MGHLNDTWVLDLGEASSTTEILATTAASDIYPGDLLTVDISIENAQELYGAQTLCTVAAAVLTPQSAVFGDFFPTPLVGVNQADAVAGTWFGAVSLKRPATPLTGNGLLATITYEAQAPGSTTVTCDPLLADENGFTLPSNSTPSGDITVLPFAILDGTLTYQGRLDHNGATVTAVGPVTQQDTTDSAGLFNINDLRAGHYEVTADAAGYLPACITADLTSGQQLTLPAIVIRGGDANDDDVINIGDATLLGSHFGQDVPPADSRADINADNHVNIQDLAILGGNYELNGCQPW